MESEMDMDVTDVKNKYQRLYESHLKLLKINQSLEEKLLRTADRSEIDKQNLIQQINSLHLQLHHKNEQLNDIHQYTQRILVENDRYKSDISVAIQLLHCQRPSTLSSCKLGNLPIDLQTKAKCHLQQDTPKEKAQSERKGGKVIRVPISAFPSTTVIYSVPSGDDNENEETSNDIVSASILAKVLEERQKESENESLTSSPSVHHSFCQQSRSMSLLDGLKYIDHGTQTYPAFIGERDKTRNTCVFCQSYPDTAASQNLIQLQSPSPTTEEKLIVLDAEPDCHLPATMTNAKHSAMKGNQQHILKNSCLEINDSVLPCV